MSIGIDAGTKSYGIYIFETDEHFEFDSEKIKQNPAEIVDFLIEINIESGAGLSGYGLPVKRLDSITEKEFFEMTLNFEKEESIGLRKVIELVKMRKLPIFTVPGVIHLQTVPDHRKINRIDMGTYDKVCSVAYILYNYDLEGSFILAELGYGFNAFIAVDKGKIIDGIGGTSGFPSYSSLSSIDGELAYLIGNIEKKVLFSGGLRSYFEDRGIDFEAEIYSEWVLKGINAVNTTLKADTVYLSGRFSKHVVKRVGEDYEAVDLTKDNMKTSAIGAGIIASGYAGREGKEVVNQLELLKARGSVFDYITSDIKKKLRLGNYF